MRCRTLRVEVLDSVLIACRLAEHERVRLPVLVNLDGFHLSFTREPVEIPDADVAREFVGSFDPEDMAFRASSPLSQAVAVLGGSPYSYFRYETHLAALNGLEVLDEIGDAFGRTFGRDYSAIETYRTEDARIVFVMIGSFATKAKDAVDRLRKAGWAVGLLRPRLLRPFPLHTVRRVLEGKLGVAVIDQNLSMGRGGVLHAELAAAFYGQEGVFPVVVSFVGGLGGRDIAIEEYYEMASVARKAAETGKTPPPRLLYTREELREIRKLQAIAQVERQKLGPGNG